jgi:hypothetical protein
MQRATCSGPKSKVSVVQQVGSKSGVVRYEPSEKSTEKCRLSSLDVFSSVRGGVCAHFRK